MKRILSGAFILFVIGTMLSCICSGRWLLNGEINIFNALASFNVMSVESGGGWGVAKTAGDYWNGIVTAFSWNYPYLQSPWIFPVRLILQAISIMAIWGFVELALSAVQGLLGTLRSLTGL